MINLLGVNLINTSIHGSSLHICLQFLLFMVSHLEIVTASPLTLGLTFSSQLQLWPTVETQQRCWLQLRGRATKAIL